MTMKHHPVTPLCAWLNVNRKCQFRCVWCYAKDTDYLKDDELSLESAKKLAVIISQMGVKTLSLLGGEPTLWDHLFNFNDFCRTLNFETVLITNGAMFANDVFWEKYTNHPCTSVGISIKAGNAEQLSEVAGVSGEMFDKIRTGIKRYNDFFTPIYSSITYNKFYEDNLLELVKMAIDHGCSGVKIDFCHPPVSKKECNTSFIIPHDSVVKTILKNYAEIHKITNGNLLVEMTIPFCFWPEDFITLLKTRNQITSVCQLQRRNGLIFDTYCNLLMCNGLFDYPIGKYGLDFHDPSSLLNFLNSEEILKYYDEINAYP